MYIIYEMIELKISSCCGTCFWANGAHTKKREVETHAAHYSIAKTERWCAKHNIPTSREAVCENGYEIDQKKGGAPAVKRAKKQVEHLQKILKAKTFIETNGPIVVGNKTYIISNDRLCYLYDWDKDKPINDRKAWSVSCKENSHDDFLNRF